METTKPFLDNDTGHLSEFTNNQSDDDIQDALTFVEIETQKRRQALTNLFQFLTSQEINELYKNLSIRKK